LDEQLKEYIAEWRKQRVKEEEDLKRLKEKQAKRKVEHQFSLKITILF
jgi:troponin T